MKALLSLCGCLALFLVIAPQALAQEEQQEAEKPDCKSICQAFPSRAPPECMCGIISPGGGAGPIDYDNLTADELIHLEREAYLDRMAGIQDYWIIEHSNITPIPTIIFYERGSPGAWPPFRHVPPQEVQKRQLDQMPLDAEQRAMADAMAEDPAAMLEGMAMAVGLLGPALANELPGGGAELEAKSDDVAERLLEVASGLRQDMEDVAEEQADEFQKLLDETDLLFEGSDVRKGVYAPGLPYGRGYYKEDAVRFQFYRPTSDEAAKWSSLRTSMSFEVPCLVLSTSQPVEIQGEDATYVIESAEKWVAIGAKAVYPAKGQEENVAAPWGVAEAGEANFAGGEHMLVPVHLRMVVRRGLEQIVITKESTQYAAMATQHRALIATVIRERIEGLSAGLPEVRKRIEVGGVNEGVPSQMDVARIKGENMGVPGADPTASGEQ